MSDRIIIVIKQSSRYQWQILNPKGQVIQDHLSFSRIDQVEDYVKAFVSSFIGWSYKIIPLEPETGAT